MIHILTVHWKTDKWIDIQNKFIKRNIKAKFKTYAFLNYLPVDYSSEFDFVFDEPIENHATKLNLLAQFAINTSNSEDDWLMFLDGDAFPIGDIEKFGREKLKIYPLVAIQRKENMGDFQPHPCFSLTTIKFWKKIKGDWRSGFCWRDSTGQLVSDVGGNLLAILNRNEIEWYPLVRSNRINLHPLWYGIYGDLIYHHGAGFRRPLSRYDKYNKVFLYKLIRKFPNRIRKKIPVGRRISKENEIIGDRVYNSILIDDTFYRRFMEESNSK